MHRTRCTTKAIYSLKLELLIDDNENSMMQTARELQGVQRFNRYVVSVYLQSRCTSRYAVDAPVNATQRLLQYDDDKLPATGRKMMQRHSWYLSQELASLALFSERLSSDEKKQLVLKT